MEDTWLRIIRFWEKIPAVSMARLGLPATVEQIGETASKIGKTFPDDFEDFYRIHNGGEILLCLVPACCLVLKRYWIQPVLLLTDKRTTLHYSFHSPDHLGIVIFIV
jgi:hypothetical protein